MLRALCCYYDTAEYEYVYMLMTLGPLSIRNTMRGESKYWWGVIILCQGPSSPSTMTFWTYTQLSPCVYQGPVYTSLHYYSGRYAALNRRDRHIYTENRKLALIAMLNMAWLNIASWSVAYKEINLVSSIFETMETSLMQNVGANRQSRPHTQ